MPSMNPQTTDEPAPHPQWLSRTQEIVKDVKPAEGLIFARNFARQTRRMPGRFRPPTPAVAAALLGLIAILATLQYRWLGRISDAERERMTATLTARAAAPHGLRSRADPRLHPLPDRSGRSLAAGNAAARDCRRSWQARYERWLPTARHPKLVRENDLMCARPCRRRLQRFIPPTPRSPVPRGPRP